MSRRERIMAICVAGALGGLAVVKGAEHFVLKPLGAVNEEIREERRRQAELRKELKRLDEIEQEWEVLAGRTLALDAQEAGRRFQRDINELAERHGLRNPKTTPGNPGRAKNGFVSVPLTLSATGTLKEVVGFLSDFYQRGYIARLDKVTLSAERKVIDEVNSPRRTSSRSRAINTRSRPRPSQSSSTVAMPTPTANLSPAEFDIGPDGPELRVNITAVTLVLPGRHEVAPKEIPELNRLPRELAAYKQIFDESIFKPYEPEIVVAPTPTPTTRPIVDTPRSTPPPPPPQPRDQHKVLVCTTALNGEPVAYVLDDRRRDEPLERYYLDEEIDDGTLLLIHPRGLVVRVSERGRDTDYFYPLGCSFGDREVLERDAHQQIWEAMRDEFVDWDVEEWDVEPGGEPIS